MKFINLTQHDINLNSGKVIPASGTVARLEQQTGFFNEDGIAVSWIKRAIGVPLPEDGTTYIVSLPVAQYCKRSDVVSPATNHQDTIRNEKGHVVSVPGFLTFE